VREVEVVDFEPEDNDNKLNVLVVLKDEGDWLEEGVV
jgi:hypothetical protein